jgi:acyl-CoA dehydrogenase
MFAPESVGGGGIGLRTMLFVEEALYRKFGPGRPLITWAKGFLSQPVLASFVDGPSHMLVGITESVRNEFIPQIANGDKTVCFALSEADAGSDVWGIKTKAKRDGDDWVINGSKQWITNSPYADYPIVFAVTDEDAVKERKGGISAFLVEASDPGYTVDTVLPVMGHMGGDCGSMVLENVRVPADRLVGELGQGFRTAMFGISEGRISIAANMVGMAEFALDRSLEYAQQRMSFGKPISDYQAIQFMLADAAIGIEGPRHLVYHAASLVDEGKYEREWAPYLSIAKTYATETANKVASDAIQILGAQGYMKDHPLERHYRDARQLMIVEGTSQIQRLVIARAMIQGEINYW